MNKSLLSKATSSRAVVTANDVGSFVKVAGVGPGILRYVGSIHGKDGLFCGIELESTVGGKHNGTYQGVSYFKCPPERGIFAPMYKVELDEPDDVPMMSLSQHQPIAERLSRSALPNLQLTNIFRPERPVDTVLDTSLTSSVESASINMDDSLFSQASWGDVDMQTSSATYIIPPGRSHFDMEEDLMNIKAPSDIVVIDEEELKKEKQRLLGESFVVEKSKIGIEHLPVVEDDEDDLLTPLVEMKRSPLMPMAPEMTSPSRLEIDVQVVPTVSEPALSPQPAKSTAPNSPHSSTTTTESRHSKSQDSKAKVDSQNKKVAEAKQQDKDKMLNKNTIRREAAPVAAPAPAAPKFPVKPKAPSKHQLMMEQLKASIEADKNKPKKEIKPRVSLAPPPPQPKQKENEPKEKMADTTPRNAKQPLKASNTALAAPPAPKPERPKKERKPLYVPPPPKERKEKEEKPVAPKTITKVVSKAAPSETTAKVAAAPSAAAPKAKPSSVQYPTSSFAGGKPRSAASASAPSTSKHTSKDLSENEKLERLKQAVETVDVLALVIKQMESESAHLNRQLAVQEAASNELKNRLYAMEKDRKEEVERLKGHTEQLTRSHNETMSRLKERHELQINEKSKEFDRTLEDEKSRQEAEMEAMSRRHQKVIGALDEKIAETEKVAEQLKADKIALQTALANDSDQRNQMLTKEINSLQTALELKSSEMKELRQKYQQIALRVEEIPLKELEITKLKHKVAELKQALDQKISYEKMLVHQNEELKRQQIMVEVEKDEMRKSYDVMVYKYETGEDSNNTSMDTSFSKYSTPGKVNFRSRSSNSSHRPPSVIPPEARLSQSSCSDMERSTDRDSLTRSTVSMYASQYKLPENHAQDVIYAPDEIICGASNIKLSQLLSESEDESSKVNGNTPNPQTDSGIVC